MWSQLARLKIVQKIGDRALHSSKHIGALKSFVNFSQNQMQALKGTEKHFFCGGKRSIGTAIELLQRKCIIALPTDTIYGFAGLANSVNAIKRLYEIKKRDENKPLAICVSNVNDIKTWAVVDNLPPRLLETLLPGPYTIVLKRTPALNPALNPGIDNVGVRVPCAKFIQSVAKFTGPLALTSANLSNERSSLHPDEFSELWSELDGIFYEIAGEKKIFKNGRKGSTIIDLSEPGKYKILRYGIGSRDIGTLLGRFGLEPIPQSRHN